MFNRYHTRIINNHNTFHILPQTLQTRVSTLPNYDGTAFLMFTDIFYDWCIDIHQELFVSRNNRKQLE